MKGPVAVYFLGTAGCGKSTLTASFSRYLEENGVKHMVVNLDPGADLLPYEPDLDVRDWVTLADVMEEHGLGPNGAQIVAADLVAINRDKVLKSIDLDLDQYVLFDTPGQMELFTFRESARELVRGVLPSTSFIVYLIDPFNARTPSGLISQLMLSSLSRLRFQLPSAEVISKADMIEPAQMERLNRWLDYPESLHEDSMAEASGSSTMSEGLSVNIFRALDSLGLLSRVFQVSSSTREGMDDIYRSIQYVYAGGEDLSTGPGPDVDEDVA
jgi:hypothetical protein